MPIDDLAALRNDVDLCDDSIGQIRSIEGTDRNLRTAELELIEDILAHPLGRRGRQCHHRRVWKIPSKLRQLTILWTKIMPPLGHAVSLVDRDHADLIAAKQFGKVFLQRALR